MNIYQITQEFLQIKELLEEEELTPELEKALVLTQENLMQKGIDYGYVIKSLEDDTKAVKQEIDRLTAIKKRLENNTERLKTTLTNAMTFFEIKKITTPTMTISVRDYPIVNILDEALIPDDYWNETVKVTRTIGKAEIKHAINEGATVEGAELIANPKLSIK